VINDVLGHDHAHACAWTSYDLYDLYDRYTHRNNYPRNHAHSPWRKHGSLEPDRFAGASDRRLGTSMLPHKAVGVDSLHRN